MGEYLFIVIFLNIIQKLCKILPSKRKKERLISISDSADDILFSGTLKAILNLLGEFTGSNQILRENLIGQVYFTY